MQDRFEIQSKMLDRTTAWREAPGPMIDTEEREGGAFWSEGDAAPLEAGSLRGARVLVVDDVRVNRLVAVAFLECWGVEAVQAGSGREALDLLLAGGARFDAVLMDIHMPDMNGHAATEALRRHFDDRRLPVIACTSASHAADVERALASGMNDFVAKPIDANVLRAVLSRWLVRRR